MFLSELPCPVFTSKLTSRDFGVITDIGTNISANKHTLCQLFPKLPFPQEGQWVRVRAVLPMYGHCRKVLALYCAWSNPKHKTVLVQETDGEQQWSPNPCLQQKCLSCLFVQETNTTPLLTFFQHYLCHAGNNWQIASRYAIQMHLVCISCCNDFHPLTVLVSFQTDAEQLLPGCFFKEASGVNIFSWFSKWKKHRSVAQHDQFPSPSFHPQNSLEVKN